MWGHLFIYGLNIVCEFSKRHIICTRYTESMFQRGCSDIFMFILDIVASVFGVKCSVITMVSFLPTVGLSFRGWRNLEGESGLS